MRSGQRSYIPGAGYIAVTAVEEIEIDQLTEEIAKGPFRTALQIVDWIDKRFQVRYSQSGVKDLLKRIGVSYHKVTGFLWKADPVAQEEWLDDYRYDPVNGR